MSLYLARSSPSVQGPVILRPDIDIEPGLRSLCDFILVRCLVTCETYRREILCIFICIFFFLLEKSRNKRLEINIDRKVFDFDNKNFHSINYYRRYSRLKFFQISATFTLLYNYKHFY